MNAPVLRISIVFVLLFLVSGCIWEILLGGNAEDGRVTVLVTDAPVDNVQQVRLTIEAVEFVSEEGDTERLELEGGFTIEDMLQLRDGQTRTLLNDRTLASGTYDRVRLHIVGGNGDSLVRERTGGEFELYTPGQAPGSSGSQDGIQVTGEVRIEAGEHTRIAVDVDLRRGLWKIPAEDHYILIPALRVVDTEEAGGVRGEVAASLLEQNTCTNDPGGDRGNAVYVYSGANAVAGDIHLNQSGESLSLNNPVTAVPVQQNTNTGVYEYRVDFLPEGDYTLALTCQALNDDPALQDSIRFLDAEERAVEAGSRAELDF